MRALPFLLITLAAFLQAAEPVEIKLWPEGAPGKMLPHSQATEDFIRTKSGKSTITDIHEPTITVYRPEKPNGTSVIVAPGGGFVFLSAIHEGTQVCEWLNTLGVTGILLKYRTPTRDETAPHEKPVADAAKAISIVREKAKEWNLNPNRIGLLGFSAGGNLLAHIACDRPAAAALPDFGVMIYGGGFVDFKEPTKLKDGFTVPADAPPMFMACAHDDGQNPTAATVLYLEYKKRELPAELHLFTKGGHGFGMRDNQQPINAWPQRCAEWMDAMGWLPTDLGALNQEIEKRKESLKTVVEISSKGIADFVCSYDRGLIVQYKKRLEEARAAGNKDEIAQLEKRLEFQQKWVEEALKPKPIKGLDDELDHMRKEISKLEAKRDLLIEAQAKSKTPRSVH
ncbi:alpha/beta hydrolase fold domain-containing protein [Brevifollis gellanilyticus]|uniref:Alpha/beta hydrolase fold-3 domain-containing protein n=1 Tax=Brevifollis gellanilyticus TaxID=748831 RepID=A0A512M4W3_9BACT|nr:alpha/beta hydrolase fold domain-containing protein [Brevifollis gellanilyticus]GEP41767.1 hypothetical protein BGE01nite_10580 [Brevifollis gellanilyticus]